MEEEVSLKKERSGEPGASRTEENIGRVRQILRENRQMTVRSIADEANIDKETGKSQLKFLT
jgi:hypothetical protein